MSKDLHEELGTTLDTGFVEDAADMPETSPLDRIHYLGHRVLDFAATRYAAITLGLLAGGTGAVAVSAETAAAKSSHNPVKLSLEQPSILQGASEGSTGVSGSTGSTGLIAPQRPHKADGIEVEPVTPGQPNYSHKRPNFAGCSVDVRVNPGRAGSSSDKYVRVKAQLEPAGTPPYSNYPAWRRFSWQLHDGAQLCGLVANLGNGDKVYPIATGVTATGGHYDDTVYWYKGAGPGSYNVSEFIVRARPA